MILTPNNFILFFVIVLLVFGDKATTYYSLHNLQKNNPKADYLQAEKNVQARWFLQKFGLGWGCILYGLVSILAFYLCIYLIQGALYAFGVGNYIGIAWYVMFLIYAFTIGNNLYFLLKHSGVLP